MTPIEKLLAKIPRKDKEKILAALESLIAGEIQGIKLKQKNEYRVRVGHYRIFYKYTKGTSIEIVGVRRRNERTYR